MNKSVINILEELEVTAGSLAKRDILELNRKNDLLKRVFVAAGDPYVVYFLNKFKMPPPFAGAYGDRGEDNEALETFLGAVLPALSARSVTGNDAKMLVESFMATCDALQQKWCQRILIRNLRCGVQESTVNKVWPGTLVSFAVALAKTLKSEFIKGQGIKLLDKVDYPVRVEPKLDGLRCIAVKKDGIVTLYTRNGSVLESMPTIKAALEAATYDNVVLDGEGMSENWNTSASIMMSNKTQKDDSSLIYHVFDAVPVADWVAQQCRLCYSERCHTVKEVVDAVNSSVVKQVPHFMAKNEVELKSYFAKCLDQNFEGLMLKDITAPYVWDRSKNILKLKPCVTYEGVIVGHYEGRRGTKNEGRWGGFQVVLPNGIVTRLGGGFNDAMKATVQLEGPDTYIGRVCELEAQPDPLTPDGLTKDGAARFPVFCRFRSESDVDPKVMAAYTAFLIEQDDHNMKVSVQ